MNSPLRDFMRDLILRLSEKTRSEVSLGIQDAVIPIVTDFITIVLCFTPLMFALFLISRGRRRKR